MTSWTGKAERGSTFALRLIVRLARIAGRSPCRLLLYPVAAYFALTDGMARRASAQFLRAVDGAPPGWRRVVAHLHSFAVTLLDRVYMASGDFRRFQITIEGLPLLEQALRAGRGCLLLGSHLGSFDLLMLTHRATDGRPITVMMRADPRARLRRIAGIDDDPMNIVPLGRPDSYLRAYESLIAGGIVAVLADRTDGAGRHLPARFLGQRIELPVGPHRLATRAGAPVLTCFGLYEGANRYRIEFAEFAPAATPSRCDEGLQPMVDRYAQRLEAYARRYPLNWFNFYPYWSVRA